MQKVLPRFVIAPWGTQVHPLLGGFKPCLFESRQINLYENNKKCHHFKEIRERIVRACGKHCCSKHRQQWEKSAATHMKRWRDELWWKSKSTSQEGTLERWKWARPGRPEGDSNSWLENPQERTPVQFSTTSVQPWRANCQAETCLKEKTSPVLPKTGHCQEQDREHMLCTFPIPSLARLQQCHIKKKNPNIFINLSQQVRYEIKKPSPDLPNPPSLCKPITIV